MGNELRYLRICPRCRNENPEQAHRCQQCDLFIGMEPAVLVKPDINGAETNGKSEKIATSAAQLIPKSASEVAVKPVVSIAHLSAVEDLDAWDAEPVAVPEVSEVAQSAVTNLSTVELQCLGYAMVLNVPSGATIGQEHPQQGADVGVPKTIVESLYLHRRHCRLDKDQGRWWLTAINQATFGRDFTNPTLINDTLLAPGERRELREGDLVRLSGLRLRVKRLP